MSSIDAKLTLKFVALFYVGVIALAAGLLLLTRNVLQLRRTH